MKAILAVLTLLFNSSAYAEWFGSYDDCILENMKGVQSSQGAYAVKQACRNKYPVEVKALPKTCRDIQLTSEEREKIKVNRKFASYDVWNTNNFKIDSVVLELTLNNKSVINKKIGSIDAASSESISWVFEVSPISTYKITNATNRFCF